MYLSINHLKKRKILAIPIEDQMYRIKAEDNEEEAPQMEIKKVIKGIRLLPAGYQQIISLYLIEGYDHIEIGEILNISSSTSKSQYHRARTLLKQAMSEAAVVGGYDE